MQASKIYLVFSLHMWTISWIVGWLEICKLIWIFYRKFVWKGVVMIYRESNMESEGKYNSHSLAGKEE